MYFSLCGGMDLYVQAAQRAGSLDLTRLVQAINAMSNSFVSAFLLEGRTLLGPGKHDAAVSYRTQLYDQGCSCFLYSGPVQQLPFAG
jgi:hypothetical protein